MKKLNTLKTCLLASYLLSSMVPAYAAAPNVMTGVRSLTKSLNHTTKATAAALFAASLYLFFSRRPDNNAVRYDLDRLKAGDFDWQNVKNFILDGVIGHAKESDKLRTNEAGEIEVKKGAPAKGIYGYVSEMVKPIGKTLGFMLVLNKLSNEWSAGVDAWVAEVDQL